LSKGIPRLLNVICDRALLGTYVQNKPVVDSKTLSTAAKEVFGELKQVQNKSKLGKLIRISAFISTAAIMVAVIFILINDRTIERPVIGKDIIEQNNMTEEIPATKKPAIEQTSLIIKTDVETASQVEVDPMIALFQSSGKET